MTVERCHAVTGTVWRGPEYCGYKSKGTDRNGRPCCGIHLDKQLGIEWFGNRRNYPAGTADTDQWHFRHGAQYLRCGTCGKRKPDVADRFCCYVQDIEGKDVLETVCNACEDAHADDI